MPVVKDLSKKSTIIYIWKSRDRNSELASTKCMVANSNIIAQIEGKKRKSYCISVSASVILAFCDLAKTLIIYTVTLELYIPTQWPCAARPRAVSSVNKNWSIVYPLINSSICLILIPKFSTIYIWYLNYQPFNYAMQTHFDGFWVTYWHGKFPPSKSTYVMADVAKKRTNLEGNSLHVAWQKK